MRVSREVRNGVTGWGQMYVILSSGVYLLEGIIETRAGGLKSNHPGVSRSSERH